MSTAVELDPGIASGWGPGTRFFSGSDSTYFVVQADLEDYSGLSDKIVRRPTVILYTDENAVALDLVVDFQFEPGTSHEDAVTGAGYTLEETP